MPPRQPSYLFEWPLMTIIETLGTSFNIDRLTQRLVNNHIFFQSPLWTLKSETPKCLGLLEVQGNHWLYLKAALVCLLIKCLKKEWSYFLKSKLGFGTKYIFVSKLPKFNHISKATKKAIIPLWMALNGQDLGVSFYVNWLTQILVHNHILFQSPLWTMKI